LCHRRPNVKTSIAYKQTLSLQSTGVDEDELEDELEDKSKHSTMLFYNSVTSFASAPDRIALAAAITWLSRTTSRKSLQPSYLVTPVQCNNFFSW